MNAIPHVNKAILIQYSEQVAVDGLMLVIPHGIEV